MSAARLWVVAALLGPLGSLVPLILVPLSPGRLAAQAGAERAAGVVAIRNATIVPVVGERIPGGTIVVRGGLIEAVGSGLPVPADAVVIDGTGLFVYPGLIDSGTRLGLTEIGSVAGGEDEAELGEFNPQDRALTAVNPHSELIPVTRVGGVTTVITGPRGGLVSGQAALVDLAGWTPTEMAVRASAGMVMTYPRVPGGSGRFGGLGPQRPEAERREQFDREARALRRFLADARAYAEVQARLHGRAGTGACPYGSCANRKSDPALEAMVPVMRAEVPAVFDVDSDEQIRGVLQLADSFGLRVIIRGASRAWRVADTLAARRIPVIVGPVFTTPELLDPYDAVYANAGVLARAGVKIAFQSADAANARNLPFHAAMAAAYGLSPEEALRAITINAAEIWGVADRYGSLERGKVANLILTTGDPLDARTQIRRVMIRGQLLPFTDRHTRLYEQFQARPRP
jgi:imidazolonepropionase-like amidohydrolase